MVPNVLKWTPHGTRMDSNKTQWGSNGTNEPNGVEWRIYDQTLEIQQIKHCIFRGIEITEYAVAI